MTETTTFPFSQLEDAPLEREPAGDRRRLAVVLSAGVLAVALAGASLFLLLGGEDTSAETAFVPAAGAPGVGAAPEAPEAPLETSTVPSANTDALARSPFEAKYVAPAPAPADQLGDVPQAPLQPVLDADGNPVMTAGDPGQSQGQTPVTGAPAEPAPGGSTTAPAPRQYALALASVSVVGGVPTASFTIDGVVSTVEATEIFGPSSQLLLRSLQQGPKDGQWTATIQMGDAEPIDVVTGETVYIR